MHTGLLWFDNDSHTTLSVKIQKAMEYYRRKFGRTPNLCLVHPSMMESGHKQMDLSKVSIRPYRSIMPGHLWIGNEDQK